MPEDRDGYIVDHPGHFYCGPVRTGAWLFDSLQPYYPNVSAMNQAIGREWESMDYKGFRLGAAQQLLEKKLKRTAG